MKHAPPVIPRSFFQRPAEQVARELLGSLLCYHHPTGTHHRVRIVETEAYVGEHDLACHASKGRTERTSIMFGPAGYAYVYLIYGMYDLLNVVTGQSGQGQAVLLRAAEPVSSFPPSAALNGPGKLTRTLGITRAANGLDLCAPPLFFVPAPPPRRIEQTPRIGVD